MKGMRDGWDFGPAAGGLLRDVPALDGRARGGGVWAAASVRGWRASVPVAALGFTGAGAAAVQGRPVQAVVRLAVVSV